MEKLNIDCLILIFKELWTDKKSLYSCLLVNREWCHLVVPILWRKYPYFFSCKKSKEKFYNIILSCLPTSSKQLLLDNDIKLPLTNLPKSLTFNYLSFCKYLKVDIVDNIINVVFKKEIFNKAKKRNLLEKEIYKLFISQCKNIKELEWQTSKPLPLFSGALTCFPQLYNLSIDLYSVNSNNLREMAEICKDLNKLCVYNYSQSVPGLISLIDAQRNLKSFSFSSHIKKGITCEELSTALTRKGRTINNLFLHGSIGVISHSFLTSLINLKDLTIYHDCESYKGIKEFQKYLANSEFPDLNSLGIYDDFLCFKEMAMLIEKTKGNISYFSVYTSNKSAEGTGMLINAISNFCSKIEYLTTYLGPKDLIYVKALLMNCKNLLSLHLNSLNETSDIGDELLDNLTKFSPKSLTYVTISGDWKYSIDAFKKFFESYRERKLLCFNIDNYIGEHFTTEHTDVVKKYFNEEIIVNSNLLF
ncbi:hypothetical protein RhiirB3_452901 [Rhizophagus irregularis]|nr:hypothetical protein RhiirB3_452901 [Rhizophagus irregularis]